MNVATNRFARLDVVRDSSQIIERGISGNGKMGSKKIKCCSVLFKTIQESARKNFIS